MAMLGEDLQARSGYGSSARFVDDDDDDDDDEDDEDDRGHSIGGEVSEGNEGCSSARHLARHPVLRSTLAVLLGCYLYATIGNITTWRTVQYHKQNPASSNLPDILFGIFQNRAGEGHWKDFLDISPGIAMFIMITMIAATKNVVRLCEVAWLELIGLTTNAIVQLVTTMPDADPSRAPCTFPQHEQLGAWVFFTLRYDACGDMLWSGHVSHFILPMIFVGFILREWQYKATNDPPEPIPLICGQMRFNCSRRAWVWWRRAYTCLVALWVVLFVIGMGISRYHYTVDTMLASIIVPAYCTHQNFLQFGVRCLYPDHEKDHAYIRDYTRTWTYWDLQYATDEGAAPHKAVPRRRRVPASQNTSLN